LEHSLLEELFLLGLQHSRLEILLEQWTTSLWMVSWEMLAVIVVVVIVVMGSTMMIVPTVNFKLAVFSKFVLSVIFNAKNLCCRLSFNNLPSVKNCE